MFFQVLHLPTGWARSQIDGKYRRGRVGLHWKVWISVILIRRKDSDESPRIDLPVWYLVDERSIPLIESAHI